MVKGSKRQIIFLPNLQASGRGLFECAYFVLRSDSCGEMTDENEMLLEAEKIVAEADRLHGRSALATKEAAEATDKAKKRSRRGRLLVFMLGMSAGAFVALLAYFAWHILCT